jgi:hypothetical protein
MTLRGSEMCIVVRRAKSKKKEVKIKIEDGGKTTREDDFTHCG